MAKVVEIDNSMTELCLENVFYFYAINDVFKTFCIDCELYDEYASQIVMHTFVDNRFI